MHVHVHVDDVRANGYYLAIYLALVACYWVLGRGFLARNVQSVLVVAVSAFFLRNLALVRLLSVERSALADPMARIGGFSCACITGILAHWRWAGRKMQSSRSTTTEVELD